MSESWLCLLNPKYKPSFHSNRVYARMAMWHGLHEVIHESQPYTFIRVVPWIRFLNRDIGNVVEYKTGLEPTEFFRAATVTPGG